MLAPSFLADKPLFYCSPNHEGSRTVSDSDLPQIWKIYRLSPTDPPNTPTGDLGLNCWIYHVLEIDKEEADGQITYTIVLNGTKTLGGKLMDQVLPTEQELEAMRNVDIHTVDPDTLHDIRDVKVNVELPKRERMLDFLRQIGNPYCYRHGKYVVKVSFAETDVTLEDRLLSYIRSKF